MDLERYLDRLLHNGCENRRSRCGKPLAEQPVVRHRLAKVAVLLESLQFVYQLTKLPKDAADIQLGGLTAMVKTHGGIVINGHTKTGQGEIAESKFFWMPSEKIESH